jgi:hypothetical protein
MKPAVTVIMVVDLTPLFYTLQKWKTQIGSGKMRVMRIWFRLSLCREDFADVS